MRQLLGLVKAEELAGVDRGSTQTSIREAESIGVLRAVGELADLGSLSPRPAFSLHSFYATVGSMKEGERVFDMSKYSVPTRVEEF